MYSIQMKGAEELRKNWAEKVKRGDVEDNCKHPNTAKEYYLGSRTGDLVCTKCGAVVD